MSGWTGRTWAFFIGGAVIGSLIGFFILTPILNAVFPR